MNPRILVIEDNLDDLGLLLGLLRAAQYHVTLAFEGMQGYQRALSVLPDLILLDVQLGSVDGFAVCRLLKADAATADIPVIFLSASNSLEERLTGLRAGAVDYVLKPFEPEEVLARIDIHTRLAGHTAPAIAQAEPVEPVEGSVDPADQVIVKAAVHYLKNHLAELPRLAEIARQVGTHEKRLTKAFRQAMGLSVFEFVRVQRLRLAERLLVETSVDISHIAAETGFSSAANFSTAFRDRFGVSPTRFRHRRAKTSDGSGAC
ncbi:MAG: DNA-binding response regulator [Variovorax sp.]|jgi:DNA-binding response OmpR family regulator|nr:DNA-binding response regulator [Variovorax sp.]